MHNNRVSPRSPRRPRDLSRPRYPSLGPALDGGGFENSYRGSLASNKPLSATYKGHLAAPPGHLRSETPLSTDKGDLPAKSRAAPLPPPP